LQLPPVWRNVPDPGVGSGDERRGVFAGGGVVVPHLVLQTGADIAIVHLAAAEQTPGAVHLGADQTNGEIAPVQRLVVGFSERMPGVAHAYSLLEAVSADGALPIRGALNRNDVEHGGFGHGSLLGLLSSISSDPREIREITSLTY